MSQTEESTSAIASAALRESVVRIRTEINELAGGKMKPKPKDPIMRIGALMKILGPIAAELRKADKAREDSVRRITGAVVSEWIRLQTPEYRARLVREIEALDSKERRSVLG